jgi:hypothetical protein
MWFNLGGHYLNATWHLPSQNGVDESKNHLTIMLTNPND